MKYLTYILFLVLIGAVFALFFKPVKSESKSVTVTAVGDSLTANDVALKKLSDLKPNLVIRNYAIGGVTSDWVLSNLRLDSDYLIVWVGINDVNHEYTAEQTELYLKEIYTRAHLAKMKVIAVTLTPYKGYPSWTPAHQATLEQVNTWILNSDADYKLNAYPLLNDSDALLPQYSKDYLHLTDEGYNLIGTELAKLLN